MVMGTFTCDDMCRLVVVEDDTTSLDEEYGAKADDVSIVDKRNAIEKTRMVDDWVTMNRGGEYDDRVE
jgi:hypothetical protein